MSPGIITRGLETGAVLTIGNAIAVVIRTSEDAPAARDRAVEERLRALTEKPDIIITRRASGRPRLAPPYPELGISMSRRGSLVLAGFSQNGRIGVDLEADTPGLEPVMLARDHFTPGEAQMITALAGDTARDAFLRLWVAKEAALKITGRGIYDGLHEPDCVADLDILMQDGAVATRTASLRLPAMRICVRRQSIAGSVMYCALAVEGA